MQTFSTWVSCTQIFSTLVQHTWSPYMDGTKCGVQNSAAALRNVPRTHLATRQAQEVPNYGRPGTHNTQIDDPAEYAHLDSPLNADMHEVVPGRIFAMRGPLDLPRGALWRDARDERGGFGHRDFTQ